MLRRNLRGSKGSPVKGAFAIIASQYNARYVDSMVQGAEQELRRAKSRRIDIFRVPGAFEIPIVAARLARLSQRASSKAAYDAIICLGVIFRGETAHADHIGREVSRALMDIQTAREIPLIHEVLLLENEQQAKVRCLDKKHNRGTEAAQTALAMAKLMPRLLG
jgi:6,7-dimethyl-8-ribityllumazine synthase